MTATVKLHFALLESDMLHGPVFVEIEEYRRIQLAAAADACMICVDCGHPFSTTHFRNTGCTFWAEGYGYTSQNFAHCLESLVITTHWRVVEVICLLARNSFVPVSCHDSCHASRSF